MIEQISSCEIWSKNFLEIDFQFFAHWFIFALPFSFPYKAES